jgi:hypothetical protein
MSMIFLSPFIFIPLFYNNCMLRKIPQKSNLKMMLVFDFK